MGDREPNEKESKEASRLMKERRLVFMKMMREKDNINAEKDKIIQLKFERNQQMLDNMKKGLAK